MEIKPGRENIQAWLYRTEIISNNLQVEGVKRIGFVIYVGLIGLLDQHTSADGNLSPIAS